MMLMKHLPSMICSQLLKRLMSLKCLTCAKHSQLPRLIRWPWPSLKCLLRGMRCQSC